MAGRYVVLCFFAGSADPRSRAALDAVVRHRALFNDKHACFFGVSMDPRDEIEGRVRESLPGLRFFWDFDGTVGRLYGALPVNAQPGSGPIAVQRYWMELDPTLRVRAVFPFRPDGSDVDQVFACLGNMPPPERFAGFEIPAPILIIPNVFEPDFCRHLIGLYEQHGGEESGFMRELDGRTVAAHDPNHKRRKDYTIEDQTLMRQIQQRIIRRVNPEIERVHFFKPTRMERYIVSCYAAEDGGHFRAHRDNTTKGTAHRRFAVSINLNNDFEGGEVSFPEYGRAATRRRSVALWCSPVRCCTRCRRSRLGNVTPSCLSYTMRRRQRSGRPTVSFWETASRLRPVLRLSAFTLRATPERKDGRHDRGRPGGGSASGQAASPGACRLRGRRGASGRLGDLKPVFGMPVEGLIQAGCRTVFSYLTKPVADNMAKAFREE